MKTPYDAAIRVCRQQLDNIRVQSAHKADEIDQIEDAQEAVSNEIRAEAELVRDDYMPFMNYALYAERKRLESRLLEQRQKTAQAELDALVEATRDAYGDFKTLATAADRWQDERAKEAGRHDQIATDEIAAQTYQRAKAA